MRIVGIRELNRDTRGVVEQLVDAQEPVLLTKQGRPIATIQPLDQERVNEMVIAAAPEFADSVARAEREFEAGETVPLAEARRMRKAKRAATPSAQRDASDDHPVRSFAALREAATATARARELSQRILDVATEQGLIEGVEASGRGDPELLETIADANARVYALAFDIASAQRALNSAIEQITAAPESEPEPEVDPDGLASAEVWEWNKRLLTSLHGGATLHEYARCLAAGADAVETAGTESTAARYPMVRE
jgi:antitoxin (DNA-binding transcriptional repressor) of toxin-antitoxin stability system